MTWGLGGAFAAAVAYGVATVLQALGARRGGHADELGARLLRRLLGSLPYVTGLLLDGLGFGLSFVALRTEPLFTVQAIVSSSLAVTALIAVVFFRVRLHRVEWIALTAVTGGLILLAMSAAPQRASSVDINDRWALLGGVAAVGAVAVVLARRGAGSPRRDAWALGVLAGLMYGAGGIGARVLPGHRNVLRFLTDPALFAIVGAGILGLLLYAMALQRGNVFAGTAAVVVAETIVPAAVGIVLLGDHTAHGRTALGAVGFVAAVSGAVALARYGEAPSTSAADSSTAEAVAV